MPIWKKRRKGMTAAEVVARQQERMRADPDYRAEVEAVEAERQAREDELRRAERPIVCDLREAGFDVSSVWDLVATSEPYPNALPILLDHLRRGGYPDRVMESLGRALAVRPAEAFWDVLYELYLSVEGPRAEAGLAVALAASATVDHIDDLVELVGTETRGDSRILLLRPIVKLGGDRGHEFVQSLRSDQVFGREARALLKKR